MYRIWIEEVLGFKLRGDRLMIVPVIPEDWQGFEMTYRRGKTVYEIAVRRRALNDQRVIEVDGRQAEDASIQLIDDGGTHKVTVWIPRRAAATPIRQPGRPVDAAGPNVAKSVGSAGALLPG